MPVTKKYPWLLGSDMPFIDIKKYLQTQVCHNDVYYYPNPGNAGDSLLAYATFDLFRKLGIQYRLINKKSFDPRGKTIIYGGGGNLVTYYSQARDFIQAYHRDAKKFIILPHTLAGNEDLLNKFNENVDIIAREEVSYNHVKSNAPKANIFLAHDLALGLNVQKTLSDPPLPLKVVFVNVQLPVRIFVQSNYVQMKCLAQQLLSNRAKTLNCFRIDQEKSNIDIPDDNLDISSIFAYGTDTEMKAFYGSYRLLKFISHYNEIRTNRLHVAIAGGLLGKEVSLYPNSYYKCEAVYNFSIKGHFPNVRWMG